MIYHGMPCELVNWLKPCEPEIFLAERWMVSDLANDHAIASSDPVKVLSPFQQVCELGKVVNAS